MPPPLLSRAAAVPSQPPRPRPAPRRAPNHPRRRPCPQPPPPARHRPRPPPQPRPAPLAAPAPPPAPPVPSAAGNNGPGSGGDRILSPVVRRLLDDNGIDPAQITGTGLGGRITRADVLDFIDHRRTGGAPAATPAAPAAPAQPAATAAPATAPAASRPPAQAPAGAAPTAGTDEIIPFTNIRRRTAEHMVRSKATSAHTLVVLEADYEQVERVRRSHGAQFRAEEGFALTYLPFVARATVEALHQWPHLNASVGDDSLIVHHEVDLGIAVDLDHNGLIVPVVKRAEELTLRGMARRIRELADRARTKKLSADDISGGTFSITNAGPFGTFLTSPIINQPQVAILSTDGVKRRPTVVVQPDGSEAIAIHSMGLLCLAWDHRAVDGAYAAAFVARDHRAARHPRLGHRALAGQETDVFRVRWLGRVPYGEAHALQRALHDRGRDDYLLLVEHPHVFTLGVHADRAHVLVDPALVGAELVASDRGGDVTYHGPGQLVAYPIVNVPTAPRSIPCHVHGIEQVVIDTLADLGVHAGRLAGFPGVWVDAGGPAPRKICAIGVRVTRGRSMHGLALNVDPGMEWFDRIVPCGIGDKAVTSLAAEGVDVSMEEVADLLAGHAVRRWAPDGLFERQDAAWPTHRASGPTAAAPPPAATPAAAAAAPTAAISAAAAAAPTATTPAAAAAAPPPRRVPNRWPTGFPATGSASGCAKQGSSPLPACPPAPANRRGCGSRPGWATSSSACGGPCATSGWSRCAKRPVARTSSSAGPTARPRS